MSGETRCGSKAVKAFIEVGANLDVRSEYGSIAVLSALSGGHADIVRLLLDAGADVSEDADKLVVYTEDPVLEQLIRDTTAKQKGQ